MNFKELFICSKDVLKILFVFYFSIVAMIFLQKYINVGNEDLMFAASLILALCIYYCMLKRKDKNLFQYLEIKPIKFNIKFIAVIFTFTVVYLLIECTIATLFAPKISDSADFNLSEIFCLFHLIILAPLVEEVIFRGLILKRLQQSLNIYFAIIIQAILFGLMHRSSMLHAILAMIFGTILAVTYYKWRNLTIPMILHSFHNLILAIFNATILYFS